MLTCLLAAALLIPADDPLLQAREHLAAGRLAEAEQLLRPALTEGGTQVRRLLAQVLVAGGDPAAAVELLDVEQLGNDPGLTLAMGRAFRAWGDALQAEGARAGDVTYARQEAAGYLEQAASLASAEATTAAVECIHLLLYTFGDAQRSLAVADRAQQGRPPDGELLLMRGCAGVHAYWALASKEGQKDEATGVAWQRAVDDLLAADEALGGERFEPWAQLVWLYEQQGQADEAVRAGLTALRRSPEADLGLVANLAWRYAAQSRWDPAFRALTEAVRLRPGELTRWTRALAERERAVRELAWAAGAHFAMDRKGATDVMAELCAAGPRDPDVWNNYGFFCREARRYEDSLAAYERAMQLAPANPRFANDCAVILHYYLKREPERASELYEHAIELASARLADENLDGELRADLKEALRDASDNLIKLARNDYSEGPLRRSEAREGPLARATAPRRWSHRDARSDQPPRPRR